MQYRNLCGKEVSTLGFGCMRFPLLDEDTANIDEKEASRMIHYAVDSGVNYLDTAWPYHMQMSEPFVGKLLKSGLRDKVLIATKLPSWLIETTGDFDRYLNEQLKKLQTDHIDYYLVHALKDSLWGKLKKLGVREWLDNTLKDGRIGIAGFSFHDELPVFKRIVDEHHWSFCQIQYNYMDTGFQAGTEGLEYAAKKGLDIIDMEPLRGGKLTNNIPPEITGLLEKSGLTTTPAALGLRWVWNRPEVKTLLSGMTTMEHVRENIEIAETALPGSLSGDEKDLIDRIRQIFLDRIKIPCSECEYCLPCPEGVKIPAIFSIYNDLHIYGDEKWARLYYGMTVPEDGRASNCVQCGQCEENCPQQIKIIDELKKCTKVLESSA